MVKIKTNNGIVTIKQIEQFFTREVMNYSALYTINSSTMGGSQGEICKVDFKDNEGNVYRLMLNRYHGRIPEYGYMSGITFTVAKYKNGATQDILWNDRGIIIKTCTWYNIDSYRIPNVFTDSLEVFDRIRKIRIDRRYNKEILGNFRIIKNPALFNTIIPIINKTRGFKSKKAKDIMFIIKNETNYTVRFYNGKDWVKVVKVNKEG